MDKTRQPKMTGNLFSRFFLFIRIIVLSLFWILFFTKYKKGEKNYGWDLDHIIPTSSVNTEDELIKLNHFSNIQPLCSYINRYIKKNNYEF